MSDFKDDLRDALLSAAGKIAKEAFNWAVGKLRDKAKEHGLDLSDDQLGALMAAHLVAVDAAVQAMASSIDHDARVLEEAEQRFRASPNVTVVDSMGESTELEASGETGEMEPLK